MSWTTNRRVLHACQVKTRTHHLLHKKATSFYHYKMPAIVVEDAAINHTSVASLGAPPLVADLLLPYPTYSSLPNISDDFWSLQLPLDESSYQDPAGTYFGYFDDEDENFGSPLRFDASDEGLWNGRFVPPPPRPPFLEDSIIADGITTCDLCSWARPTKSTFTFDGTIVKSSDWPLAIIIVAVISAIIGAMLMITIVRYRRKKSSNRNEPNAVQWWSRNKQRQHTQSVRRNNIYTGNPADSIRGLPQNVHHPNQRRSGTQNNNNNNPENEPCNWSNVTNFVVNS